MFVRRYSRVFLLPMVIGILVFALAACTPSAPATPTAAAPVQTNTPSAVDTATLMPATATSLPATATIEPATATAVPPTATTAPTATIAPAEQVKAWCVLKDKAALVKASEDPAVMPEGASEGKLEKDTLVLFTPSNVCTFVFNLGIPMDGMVLQVLDGNNTVWLKAPLQSVAGNRGYAVLKHSYIVEPPYWNISYKMQLVGSDGTTKWSGMVEMRNYWMPEKCWDGTMPNFKTLACKKQQDLHPWDPAYTPPPPSAP